MAHSTYLAVLAAIGLSFCCSSAAQVTIETDKQLYALGEPVQITLTNHLAERIRMSGYPPWDILDPDTQAIVAGCGGLPIIYEIEPGESGTFTWDQTGCGSTEQVPPGMYWAAVTYWPESQPSSPVQVTTPLCVDSNCAPTPVDEPEVQVGSWGRVKSLYD